MLIAVSYSPASKYCWTSKPHWASLDGWLGEQIRVGLNAERVDGGVGGGGADHDDEQDDDEHGQPVEHEPVLVAGEIRTTEPPRLGVRYPKP